MREWRGHLLGTWRGGWGVPAERMRIDKTGQVQPSQGEEQLSVQKGYSWVWWRKSPFQSNCLTSFLFFAVDFQKPWYPAMTPRH